MSSTSATLTSLLDMTNAYLGRRLDGLTDDEWLWEPVPGCWSIRDGAFDFALPEPSPPPVTTIAWRLQHLQACNDVERHWMCEEDREWGDPEVPRSAEEGTRLWMQSAVDLRHAIAALTDQDLEVITKRDAVGRVLGPGLGLPKRWFATTLVRENVHHGAEIGVLRDLFRTREASP